MGPIRHVPYIQGLAAQGDSPETEIPAQGVHSVEFYALNCA